MEEDLDEAAAENSVVETAVEPPAERRLPADFRCLWCGYDVGGSATWRCPECGREFDEVDFKTQKLRQHVSPRVVRNFIVRSALLGGVLIGALVAVMMSRLIWVFPWGGLFALAVMLTMVMTVAGGGLCLFAPGGFRKFYLAVWLSVLNRLHSLWIVVGAGAPVFFLAGYLVERLDLYRMKSTVFMAMFVGGVIWLILVLTTFKTWTGRIGDMEHRLGLLRTGFRNVLIAAGWATLACTIVLSLSGGILAAIWTAHIMKY
jgi:hypothetical protein